jgi:hypothetical protein
MEGGFNPNFGGSNVPSHKRHAKSKGGLIDASLANVANSVSGFYKDGGGASDHQSNMSRT